MRPAEWARVKELFEAARPLPAGERSRYLFDMCNDDGLRAQVEALLASHQHATSFLETPLQLPEDLQVGGTLDGRRLGPYQILSKIGSGGMGHVYKARDTRLDRMIAVKVLAWHIAGNAAARNRFEHEARAVAALNHPNICMLHDVGTQNGVDYLVMEYLEGETLAVRLQHGPLPGNSVLQYGLQIASALDRVHRAGIVHRDLKPGNIMLTKGGIKLLDFGLSRECVKATDSEQPPSVSLDMTSPGHLLGTIQYMSPEQTEGRVADARSDIFAFGAVLYEMMAGQRAFQGDTHSKLATAIREHEPPLLAAIPPSLDRVVRTCLAKDPDERWQTARDLLRELQWIANGLRDVTDPRTGASRHLRLVASSFIIMTIVMAGALAWLRYGSVNWGEAEHPPVRFEVATPATSDPMSFALSPDGRQLAFVAMDNYSSKLWIRRIDQIDARSLRGTDGAIYPFWSPDSHTVAYFARGKLNTVDLRNESHRVLADAPNGRGGTWNTDGVIVFAPETAGPLMRVFANGGTSVPATRLIDGEHNHRWPQFLPDGRHFLFLSTQGRQTTIGVFVGSLMGGDTIRVLDDESPAAYAAGSLLVVRRGTLLAYPFDADHAKVIGEPNTVAQPIGFDTASSRSAFSVSENGAVAFRTGIADRRQLVWLTRDGTPDGSVGPPDDSAIAAPELTRDGQKLAVHRTVESNDDVWTMNVQNGVPSRFTSEAGGDLFPIWSPDGKQIVFVSNRNRSYGLFERPSDGSREERQVLASELKVPTDFSPDGTTLLYAIPVSKRGDVDIWAQRIDGSASPIPVAHSKFDEMAGQFSPDGRLVAYQSNASGRMEIYLTEFPTSSVHEQVSTSGGSQPRWRPDGRELFYIAPDGQMTAAGVQPGSLDTGRTVALFQTRLATGANIPSASGTKQQYAVSRDGRFLMNISVAPPPPITLLLNWHTAVNTSAER